MTAGHTETDSRGSEPSEEAERARFKRIERGLVYFYIITQIYFYFKYSSGFFLSPFTRTSKWMWMPVAP